MTEWTTPRGARKAAMEVFPGHKPNVTPIGERQFLLSPTPYGQIVTIPVKAGYLVAAEQPPEGQVMDVSVLEPRLAAHLERNHLRPWRVVQSHDLADVIRQLGQESQPVSMNKDGPWSPYLTPMKACAKWVGETRQRCLEQVKALVAASRGGPLAQVVGMEGVGKRVMAAAIAAQCKWNPVELPLSRFLVDRIVPTAQELLLEALVTGVGCMGEGDLLVVSDADLLHFLPPRISGQLRGEVARMPHALLLARPTGPQVQMPDVISIGCPGLDSLAEAREVLAAEHPEVEFAGAASDMVAGAAHVEGVGIVPKRLLYITRLSAALVGAQAGAKAVLSPDDVATPIRLARAAWAERDANAFKGENE